VRADWPELSDLIYSTDPQTLELENLRNRGMRYGFRIVERIPGHPNLDEFAVDRILLTSHLELQRLSVEFRIGQRVLQLLHPLIISMRNQGTSNIRIVDVGCGLGYLIRWLAAFGELGDDVVLAGFDFNHGLIAAAQKYANADRLKCSFFVADAFAQIDTSAQIFVSTGALHHFRDNGLRTILQLQVQRGAAFVHTDIKETWAAPIGAWVFHRARMREPLARHEGVLSAVRAHSRRTLIDTVQQLPDTHEYGLFDGRHSILPILRTLQSLIAIRREFAPGYHAALGASAQRYEVLR
jgi:SAM-dependent methyltransferase